jgi:hypothetical protein
MRRLAVTDPLTELGNHRLLDEYLRRHFALDGSRAADSHRSLRRRINCFRPVNDTAEHAAGTTSSCRWQLLRKAPSPPFRTRSPLASAGTSPHYLVSPVHQWELLS